MDEKYFAKKWFGKIGLDMMEFKGEFVGVHLHQPHQTCKLFKLDAAEFETPEIWRKLHELSDEAGILDTLQDACPNCQMSCKTWGRSYQGYKFCGKCGGGL